MYSRGLNTIRWRRVKFGPANAIIIGLAKSLFAILLLGMRPACGAQCSGIPPKLRLLRSATGRLPSVAMDREQVLRSICAGAFSWSSRNA
jgi:hypothetical protein